MIEAMLAVLEAMLKARRKAMLKAMLKAIPKAMLKAMLKPMQRRLLKAMLKTMLKAINPKANALGSSGNAWETRGKRQFIKDNHEEEARVSWEPGRGLPPTILILWIELEPLKVMPYWGKCWMGLDP